MREILDRLRETMTALDKQCMEEYYGDPRAVLSNTMGGLWRAKYHVWRAQIEILNTAAGAEQEDPT